MKRSVFGAYVGVLVILSACDDHTDVRRSYVASGESIKECASQLGQYLDSLSINSGSISSSGNIDGFDSFRVRRNNGIVDLAYSASAGQLHLVYQWSGKVDAKTSQDHLQLFEEIEKFFGELCETKSSIELVADRCTADVCPKRFLK